VFQCVVHHHPSGTTKRASFCGEYCLICHGSWTCDNIQCPKSLSNLNSMLYQQEEKEGEDLQNQPEEEVKN
jgi:hypothetical protein